jgi:hypothetical protein
MTTAELLSFMREHSLAGVSGARLGRGLQPKLGDSSLLGNREAVG